ncbi:MAG: methyltransferase [Bacillota bacterium]|nr:methyltransferase [Bacillota bacterium]
MQREKEITIGPNERVDDLDLNGLKVVQNPDYFCFGIDAVLLANYARFPQGANVAEFCAGNAVVSILLTAKQKPRKILAMEFQPELVALAEKSIRISGVSEIVEVVHDDILHAERYIKPKSLDAIVINPPYVRKGAGLACGNLQRSLARQESTVGPEEIFELAARLLKTGGELFMVNRPDRLVDIFVAARKYGVEPRELTMVQPSPCKAPNICLIRCKKRAGMDLKMLPPIHVYDEDGNYNY